MKRFTLIMALALSGCATTPRAVATYAVAASDIAADTLADGWAQATTQQVGKCRALGLDSVAAREECLGKFHPAETDKVIAAVQTLITAQLAVKEAAACESLQACAGAVDWAALATQAKAAWDALKPYAKILKERDQ
jgi:hypothetical protein